MAPQAGQVEKGIGTALALALQLACPGDSGGGFGAVVARLWPGVEGGGLAGHGQVQVDAIEQRAGQLVAIALDLFRRAAAASAGFAKVSAGAGVHRRDQLEACRELHPVAGPGDDDLPGLEW